MRSTGSTKDPGNSALSSTLLSAVPCLAALGLPGDAAAAKDQTSRPTAAVTTSLDAGAKQFEALFSASKLIEKELTFLAQNKQGKRLASRSVSRDP